MSAGKSVITDAGDVTPDFQSSVFWLQVGNKKITRNAGCVYLSKVKTGLTEFFANTGTVPFIFTVH
jgi:hypothetical protein